MHPRFPIECTCSHRAERFQLAFARRALDLVPRAEDTAYEADARGLLVRAETEPALERPVRVLREIFGDELRVGPPTVRYHHDGETLEEPHMGVRVLCAPAHFRVVVADLEARNAKVLDAEVNEQFGVIRATAPLAALIGYPRRLAELTAERARYTMWLSHYAPVAEPPPGGDAA